jgi:hypothetical protein
MNQYHRQEVVFATVPFSETSLVYRLLDRKELQEPTMQDHAEKFVQNR